MNKKLPKLNILKSNYGPKSFGLYSQEDNAKRKESRTGESVDAAGPNLEVRYAGPTRSQQAENQARADKLKSKKNPVKIFTAKERKQLARKRGLLAASEDMKKAPLVDSANEDINWPKHPTDEGKYVKTMTHKDSGHKIHVVHMKDRDEDMELHTGSIYYITHNGLPDGKPIARTEVGHLNHETGDDYDPHFKAALTEPEHRGKGLNTILHLGALKDYKKLKSDYRLSPGSQKTYEKLAQHPNVKANLMPTQGTFQEKHGNQTLNVFPQDTQHSLQWKKPKKLAASEDMKKAPQLENQDDDFAFKQLDKGSFDDRFHTNLVTRKLKNGLFHHVFSMKNSPDNVIHSISSGNPEYPHSVIVGVKANPEKDGTDANFVARYTATHPDHQGKGMATGLKKLALKHHGSIQSDGIVSDGEHASWQKLGRVSGIDLKPGKTQYDLADEDGDPDEGVQEHHEYDAVYFPHVATYKKPKKLAASKLAKGARGDWKKEGYTLHIKTWNDQIPKDKIHLFNPKEHDFSVVAKDSTGKVVGYSNLYHEGSRLYPAEISVDKKHQRKGLASAMYDHAYQNSNKHVYPSTMSSDAPEISQDAEKFWDNRLGRNNE
mgnify:CR=1 FL=1